jgi:hypothetical protein
MKADWRLIVLLALAVAFMVSAIPHSSPPPVYIEGNFIAFDTSEVFGTPVLEDECFEPSPIGKTPVF